MRSCPRHISGQQMTEQASRLIALLNQNDPSAYEEIRNALAKSQISPDAADDNGATLLLCALRRRQEDIAQLLLDEGANPFIISKYGQSAAGFMAQSGNEVWKQIIGDWGEAFSGSDVKGEAWPVLQGACRAAALGECKELPQKLLKEDRDAWGHTALMLAVMHGQAAAAEALLKAGADPQAPQTLLGLPMIRFMNAAVPLQHPDLTTAMRTAYAGLFPNGLPAQSDDDADLIRSACIDRVHASSGKARQREPHQTAA